MENKNNTTTQPSTQPSTQPAPTTPTALPTQSNSANVAEPSIRSEMPSSSEMPSDNNVQPNSLFEVNINKSSGTMDNMDTMDTRPDNLMSNNKPDLNKDTIQSNNRMNTLQSDNRMNTLQSDNINTVKDTTMDNNFNKVAPKDAHDNMVKHTIHDNMNIHNYSNRPTVSEEYRGIVIVKKESNKSVILKWIGWLILMCVFVIIILWWINSFNSHSCSKILDTSSDVRMYKKQVSWRKPLTQVRMFSD